MANYCTNSCNQSSYHDPLKDLPVAMGYVPWQTYKETLPLCKALQVGTIFPELCKPFCGKRGVRS